MGRRVASCGNDRLAILRSARPLWSAGERNSARSRGENQIKEDRRWDYKIYCAQKEVSRRRGERNFVWHRTRNCPPGKFSDIAAREPGTGWHRILRGRKTQRGTRNGQLGYCNSELPIVNYERLYEKRLTQTNRRLRLAHWEFRISTCPLPTANS